MEAERSLREAHCAIVVVTGGEVIPELESEFWCRKDYARPD